jgi:hypothetical protein
MSCEDELLGICCWHGDTSATGGGSTSTIEIHSRVAGNVSAAHGTALNNGKMSRKLVECNLALHDKGMNGA